MIHIVAERSIPYLQGFAERVGRVTYIDNQDFSPSTIASADALLVRSITRCNEALLSGSNVRYIATATAGSDHIDAIYCQRMGIEWTNAPGCNAKAVAQWVLSALSTYAMRYGISLEGKTLGIVGVGNVGKQVQRLAPALGLKLLLCDPPRQQAEDNDTDFVGLDEICRSSDIITLHVPLTSQGQYATKAMVDESFVKKCQRSPILINACRGAVTKTQALLQGRREGLLSGLLIDCWEGEPMISRELLELADVVSPHIAGFSADGKFAGARMALGAIARHWGIEVEGLMDWSLAVPAPRTPLINLSQYPIEERLYRAILHTLDLEEGGCRLRANPEAFESLRKGYNYPREMQAYCISSGAEGLEDRLRQLDFSLD